ncbi:otogelin [Cololabis saira]|uniref:otogelin n=1 Tax=Cololabis saira TaxID=129043 RepID=UPI002AD221A9|nr:otogelin [Cololabis saira]
MQRIQRREQQDKAAEMGHRFPGRAGPSDDKPCTGNQHICIQSVTGQLDCWVQPNVFQDREDTKGLVEPRVSYPTIDSHNINQAITRESCEHPCLNGGQCIHPESCDCSLYQATGYRCQTVPNPGFEREMTCRSWGQYNFETFDGLYFYFPGRCTYTLLKDCEETTQAAIVIQVHNDAGCSSAPYTCQRSVSVFLPWDGEIRLHTTNVTYKGRSLQLPHHIHDLQLEQISQYVLVTQTQGFTLAWEGRSGSVYIKLNPEFVGRTCGLCGNFNADVQDDMKTSYGLLTDDIEMFGNSWVETDPHRDRCPTVPSGFPSPCAGVDPDVLVKVEEVCAALLDPPFQSCHDFVSPLSYMASCSNDLCMSGPSGDVVCQVFSEYARACAHADHPLHDWRRHIPQCVKPCPLGLQHRECISCCPASCSLERTCIDSRLACLDGCYCPDGLIYEDGSCVTPSDCPCEYRGMFYPSGQTLQEECNNCTCLGGVWTCTDYSCPGECSVTGDMYFESFDGRIYTFPATCQYVLAKSRSSGKFTVTIQNAPCGANLDGACIQSVNLVIDEDPRTEITLSHVGEVFMAGQYRISLPYSDDIFHIQELSSMFLQVRTSFGLRLQYSPTEFRLYLQADESWKDNTVGLCGTFNGNIQDDFLSPSGMIESTPQLFGNSWKVSSACSLAPSTPQLDPCDAHQQAVTYASEMCDVLNQDLFSACHEYLSPTPFHQQCRADTCKCGTPCLCSALAHYARHCRRFSIIIDFRSHISDCAVTCPATMQYGTCVSSCQRRCTSLSVSPHCGEECEEGCVCPQDSFYNHRTHTCVHRSECPCSFLGADYEPGDVIMTSAGVQLCLSGKLVSQTADIDVLCPAGQVYQSCSEGEDGLLPGRGVACERTCESYLLNITCSTHEPCVAGCTCPPGLLKHGDECFEPAACPCLWKGKEYFPGDRVSSSCYQCVCQHGTFQCVFRACPSMCTAYGDRHYRTFDGLLFDYVGACKVYLVKSSADVMLSITAENVDCFEGGVICRKSILISIGRSFVAFDDDTGKPNPSSVIDRRQQMLVWPAGYFTVIHFPEEDVTVLWDRKTTVHVQVGPRWQGKLSGLCGNFDLKTVNEMRTPDNIDSPTPQEFGNSWTATECVNSPDIRHPCTLSPLREPFAKRQCGVLLSEVFQTCHPVVDVTWFYMNCLADTCACSRGGDCECFCTSVAAYAQRCCHEGVPVDWRSPSLCPYDCEFYNKVLGKGPFRLFTFRDRTSLLAVNRSGGFLLVQRANISASAAPDVLSLFMMTPGLSRARPHDTSRVSFEAADRPNYFLHALPNGQVRLAKWEESEAFWDGATFVMHRNTWIAGYDSLESHAKPGFFLYAKQSRLHLLKYRHADIFRKATLFRLSGPGPDNLPGPRCQWRYDSCVSPCFKTCSDPSAEACVTIPQVEGCLPVCPPHMVLDEVTRRCVYVEDCMKVPAAALPATPAAAGVTSAATTSAATSTALPNATVFTTASFTPPHTDPTAKVTVSSSSNSRASNYRNSASCCSTRGGGATVYCQGDRSPSYHLNRANNEDNWATSSFTIHHFIPGHDLCCGASPSQHFCSCCCSYRGDYHFQSSYHKYQQKNCNHGGKNYNTDSHLAWFTKHEPYNSFSSVDSTFLHGSHYRLGNINKDSHYGRIPCIYLYRKTVLVSRCSSNRENHHQCKNFTPSSCSGNIRHAYRFFIHYRNDFTISAIYRNHYCTTLPDTRQLHPSCLYRLDLWAVASTPWRDFLHPFLQTHFGDRISIGAPPAVTVTTGRPVITQPTRPTTHPATDRAQVSTEATTLLPPLLPKLNTTISAAATSAATVVDKTTTQTVPASSATSTTTSTSLTRTTTLRTTLRVPVTTRVTPRITSADRSTYRPVTARVTIAMRPSTVTTRSTTLGPPPVAPSWSTTTTSRETIATSAETGHRLTTTTAPVPIRTLATTTTGSVSVSTATTRESTSSERIISTKEPEVSPTTSKPVTPRHDGTISTQRPGAPVPAVTTVQTTVSDRVSLTSAAATTPSQPATTTSSKKEHTASLTASPTRICTPPYAEIIDECTKYICVNNQLILFNKSQSCPFTADPPHCGLLGFAVLVNGDKCCPKWDCPCRCSVFPDLNVITFDGNSVAIYKAASYIVTQLPNETVSVLIQECPPGSESPFLWNFTNLCLVSLNITHNSDHVIINRLQRRLYVNSRYAKPRFKKYGFEIYDTGNMYLIRSPAGLKMQWYHSTGMMVVDSDSSSKKLPTMGLCGFCDGDPSNDLTMANGTTLGTNEDPAVFIDSWQVSNTTGYISHSRRRELNCSTSDCSSCLAMLEKHAFTPCHAFVTPSTFCEVWVRDSEYVNNQCVALAAYVASCHKFNICIEWRRPDYCPFICPDTLRYQACLPACTSQSCPNHDFDSDPDQCSGLTEGCVCPEGTLLHRPYSALCIPPERCACTDSSGGPRAHGEVWKASKDGCCMYRCDNDTIVSVQYNCSNIPLPTCHRTGEVIINMADDTSCCPQKVCVCNQSLCETLPADCKYGEKLVSYYRRDSCCPDYACECDPELCESNIPTCRDDQTLIATRADGSCCLAHICMCSSCSESPPLCQDGEVLTVDGNTTDRCCPAYQCVCEPYRCPQLSCPVGMSVVSVSTPDRCCPNQTCECSCEKISSPKCGLGEAAQLDRTFLSDPQNQCACKTFKCVREAVCVFGERGVLWPGQTLVERGDDGLCHSRQCSRVVDVASGFHVLRTSSINCSIHCQPNQIYIPPKDQSSCCGVCKNISCLYQHENGTTGLYKPGKSWVSNCMNFNCTDTLSGPTLISYSFSCPPFNETECVKIGGTVVSYMDGCCQTCKEDGKSCQKVTVRMTIRKNDCRSNRPVNIVSCDGKCPSASIYNYNINTYARFCKCCRETGLQRRSVQLYCSSNATWVSYTIQEPTDCSCQWS